MCKFCESLINGNSILWNQRSTFAIDNFYEFMYELNEYESVSDIYNFGFLSHEIDGDYYLSLEYLRVIKSDKFEVTINPFTESINLNFCPNCGKQLSKNISDIKYNKAITIIE